MKELIFTNQYGDKKRFYRVSRWITIRQNCNPCERNGLWDYVEDGYGLHPYQFGFNLRNGLYLDYFRFGGKNYAIGQFVRCGSSYGPVSVYSCDENGETIVLSAVDYDCNIWGYNGWYMELSDTCDKVRLYCPVDLYRG